MGLEVTIVCCLGDTNGIDLVVLSMKGESKMEEGREESNEFTPFCASEHKENLKRNLKYSNHEVRKICIRNNARRHEILLESDYRSIDTLDSQRYSVSKC